MHVPYDNVAPSVSSSQLDNNARGNSSSNAPAEEQAVQTSTSPAASDPVSYTGSSDSNSLNARAQAPFIAQLAAQSDTQETHIVLAQYEKLVEISNVKYKPSFAFKPAAEPSGIYGRILASEKTSIQAPQAAPSEPTLPLPTVSNTTEAATLPLVRADPIPQNSASTSADAVIVSHTAQQVAAPLPDTTTQAPIPAANTSPSTAQDNSTPIQLAVPPSTPLPTQAISAYTASTARVNSQNGSGTQASA